MFDIPQKFYELCRLCLSPDGVKCSIFEEEGIQRSFAEKISACLSITVSTINNSVQFFSRGARGEGERETRHSRDASLCLCRFRRFLFLSLSSTHTHVHVHSSTHSLIHLLYNCECCSFLSLFSLYVFAFAIPLASMRSVVLLALPKNFCI